MHGLAIRWWSPVLRGVAAIIFGILTFVNPGITLAVLVLFFGVYALVDGVLNLFAAFGRRGEERWWELLLEGIISIAAGVVTLVWPRITAIALLVVIALWAIVTGIFELVAAVRLRKVIRGEWLLALSGIASVLFGILLFVYPRAGALAIAIWIGAYAIIFGGLLVGLGFRLRSLQRRIRPPAPREAPAPA